MVNTLFFIPINKRCSLCVIDIETFLDSIFVVIASATLFATIDKACHEFFLWNRQFNHCCNLVATFIEHLLQRFCLWCSAWKTVEDNTFMLFTEAVIDTCKNINHQCIGYQLTIVNIAFGGLAKRCSILDFIT